MKTLTKTLIIIAITLQSCGIGGAIDPNPKGTFTAEIDGKKWKAEEVSAITLFGAFSMTASDGDEVFSLSFLGSSVKEGETYIFPSEEGVFNNVAFDKDGEGYFAESGTLKITKYKDNKTAEGEFDFILSNFNENKLEVKNGKFKVDILI